MSTTAGSARALLESTGHAVVTDPSDAGVLRSYRDGRLVGLVVIRDAEITYAEHDGVIFPFHKTRGPGQRRAEIEDYRATVRESVTA